MLNNLKIRDEGWEVKAEGEDNNNLYTVRYYAEVEEYYYEIEFNRVNTIPTEYKEKYKIFSEVPINCQGAIQELIQEIKNTFKETI